ncbi:MAG: histidinol dehydrogenase, partial [Solirubrobacteraceae bacterium]
MRLERRRLGGPDVLVREIRAMAPEAASVAAAVSEIIAAVVDEGDAALRRYTAQFDVDPPPMIRVDEVELAEALANLDPAVRAGLEMATANVAEVAWAADTEDRSVSLPEGHRIIVRE